MVVFLGFYAGDLLQRFYFGNVCDVLAKARAEIQKHFGDYRGPITREQLRECEYVTLVSTRVYFSPCVQVSFQSMMLDCYRARANLLCLTFFATYLIPPRCCCFVAHTKVCCLLHQGNHGCSCSGRGTSAVARFSTHSKYLHDEIRSFAMSHCWTTVLVLPKCVQYCSIVTKMCVGIIVVHRVPVFDQNNILIRWPIVASDQCWFIFVRLCMIVP